MACRAIAAGRKGSTLRSFARQRSQSRYVASYAGNRCVGLLREASLVWERRAALPPAHVKRLVDDGCRCIVQPCNKRVFEDEEYRQAGAEISNDVSAASVVLGIKQVPPENLLPGKNYLFFSHTIKAQPENMPLLDAIVENEVRLFDYETIVSTGERPKRLVAFGRFAGMAGLVDILQGLGQRLLLDGYSTPFLNCPVTYMHSDLNAVRRSLAEVGDRISRYGLPAGLSPMVFLFTGTGNVSQGAQEMFKLLPHRMVDPSELPTLRQRVASGELPGDVLYGAVAEPRHMVRRKDGRPFDRADYAASPDAHEAIFHELACHASVLVNCMYWDARFPRLLTHPQMREMATSSGGYGGGNGGNGSGNGSNGGNGGSRLLAVADISCDVGGAVEFLEKSTTVQRPFFLYDPVTGAVHDEDLAEVPSSVVDHGPVLMMGVDILPSELPADASIHFGDAILPFVKALADAPGSEGADDLAHLPPELALACVASHGQLTERFQYIEKLRRERERAHRVAPEASAGSMPTASLLLQGHLFDSGLINRALDAVEALGGFFTLVDCFVEPNLRQRKRLSSAVIRVDAATPALLEEIVAELDRMCRLTPAAEATLGALGESQLARRHQQRERRLSRGRSNSGSPKGSASSAAGSGRRMQGQVSSGPPRVLVLGAGMTCGPLVEYLGRGGARKVTVGSAVPGQAAAVAALAKGGEGLTMDAGNASNPDLQRLVREHEVVVSMLPAPMHPAIAELCVANGTDLVTASYVGPEMQALHAKAAAAGVRLVNEAGLDPGMDHMAIMRVIDDVTRRGGSITALTSVCGGLPAPEAADNPLRYKFSWSPMGVLRAAANAASFRRAGRVVSVPGDALLASAEPAEHPWGALALEQLPNRDSLQYGDLYGVLESAQTLLRGTLRYAGWSDVMLGLRSLGLFSDAATAETAAAAGGGGGSGGGPPAWPAVFRGLAASRGFDARDPTAFLAAAGVKQPAHVIEALEWLGLLLPSSSSAAAAGSDSAAAAAGDLADGATIADATCALLQRRCAFGPGERDLVLMHHRVDAAFPGGRPSETHLSSLLLRGGPNFSAMARTVGVTAAVAAELVLEGAISTAGVVTPTAPELYEPALQRLEAEGIRFVESVRKH